MFSMGIILAASLEGISDRPILAMFQLACGPVSLQKMQHLLQNSCGQALPSRLLLVGTCAVIASTSTRYENGLRSAKKATLAPAHRRLQDQLIRSILIWLLVDTEEERFVKSTSTSRYITLSNVCGQVSIGQTTSANFIARQQKNALAALPQFPAVIQDAWKVVEGVFS